MKEELLQEEKTREERLSKGRGARDATRDKEPSASDAGGRGRALATAAHVAPGAAAAQVPPEQKTEARGQTRGQRSEKDVKSTAEALQASQPASGIRHPASDPAVIESLPEPEDIGGANANKDLASSPSPRTSPKVREVRDLRESREGRESEDLREREPREERPEKRETGMSVLRRGTQKRRRTNCSGR